MVPDRSASPERRRIPAWLPEAEPLEGRRLLTVYFDRPSYLVSQQDGQATITLVRSPTVGPERDILATADGTAVAGVDYTETRQVVDFQDGESTKTVTIPITKDAHNGPEKSVTLNLIPGSGSPQPITASLVIADRADVTAPTVQLPKLLTRGSTITGLTLTFSKAMSPGAVQDPHSYSFFERGRHGLPMPFLGGPARRRPFSNGGQDLKSAVYDPATHAVTLTFVKPIPRTSSFTISSTYFGPPFGPPLMPGMVARVPLTDLNGNLLNAVMSPVNTPGSFSFSVTRGVVHQPGPFPPYLPLTSPGAVPVRAVASP